MVKLLSALFLVTFTASAFGELPETKIPKFAKTNFKIGQYAVFVSKQEGKFASALVKVFGLELNPSQSNNPKIAVEFIQHPTSDGQFEHGGLYTPEQSFSKLFHSLKGWSVYKKDDPVYLPRNNLIAKVFGVYYGLDASPLHCLKFIGGEYDGKYGCGWSDKEMQLIRIVKNEPLSSQTYASHKDESEIYTVIGEVGKSQVLLRNIDTENIKIAAKEDCISIHTTEEMKLEPLSSDTLNKSENTDEPKELIEPPSDTN